MVIPGKVVKETRAKFASIIERYHAGDANLHAEIKANASSAAPIAQVAMNSLGMEQDHSLLGTKRKMEELEVVKMQLETQRITHELYAMACPNGKPDDRLLFKDNIYNLMSAPWQHT